MGKGGTSTTNTVDYAYNQRMADIAQATLDLTKEQYYATADTANEYQNALYKANTSLIPAQTDLQQSQLNAANALIPSQTATMQNYYNATSQGVNVKDKMAQAQADVVKQLAGQTESMNRDAARAGVNINSGGYAKQANANAINAAQMIAGARTSARTAAEDTNYNRLATASSQALSSIYSS